MSEIWTHVRDPEIRESFACEIGNPSVLNPELSRRATEILRGGEIQRTQFPWEWDLAS